MNLKEIRNYFPYLKTGKTYFNNAVLSPISTIVKEKIEDYLHLRSETDIEPYFKTLPQTIGAKDKLAKLLNVNSNLIAWSANVSNSLNILAQGLDWKHGDEIILNNIEFPSNIYPFLNLNKKGVEILFAQAENGIVDLQQIEKLVSPRTKLVSISMIQFLTGYRADLKSIGDFCKKNNILFCVDGIQGVGVVQINLTECNIDFFAGGSHKWLMGLQGLGYFYLSQKLLDIINQKHVGWTSVKNPWDLLDYNLNLLESAARFQIGTLPRIAIIALDASLSLFEEIGNDKIENQIVNNSFYLKELLIENGYKPILAEISKENMGGIVSFSHPDSVKIVKQLEHQNVICSVREGLIRVSPHFYNTREEFDYLIESINKITSKK